MANQDMVVVAVDQGTSSTKTIVTSTAGDVLATNTVPLQQTHPFPGWVEQSPTTILNSVREGLRWAKETFGDRIGAVGLSTQRESAVAWDDATGEPLSPVLGWQDRRTTARARELHEHSSRIRHISGLPLDPMFSALKFEWILNDIDPDRASARAGRIKVGTVDSWIVRSLTGESRIEIGNASRTQLLDVTSGQWSADLLALFNIPVSALPRLAASDEPTSPVEGEGVTITAVLGDSHAALYGHGVRQAGEVKVTYGTGSSVMGLEAAPRELSGVVRTIAWQTAGTVSRAFEGNILATGATVIWLSRLLGITPHTVFEEALSGRSVIDLVPAFSGLGAPWWDEKAVGLIAGFDLGTAREDLSRAAVESIPLQIEDVLAVTDNATGTIATTVLADGGPSSNDWLMQLQADLSQRTVRRSNVAELSGLGAAHLAGITAGIWNEADVAALPRPATTFTPQISSEAASQRRSRWLESVSRARSHVWDSSDRLLADVHDTQQQ
jgi:glycerol kinase